MAASVCNAASGTSSMSDAKVARLGASMDWPLSRDEKRACVIRLYEKDLHAANDLLYDNEATLEDLREEVKVLRRASLSGPRPSISPRRTSTSDCSTAVECEEARDLEESEASSDGGTSCTRANASSNIGTASGQEVGAPTPQPETQVGRGGLAAGIELDLTPKRCNIEEVLESPRMNTAETRLRDELMRFFGRHAASNEADVARMARDHAANGVPELWAKIGLKYKLPAPLVVQWLSSTLTPFTPVQWATEHLPPGAGRALVAAADAHAVEMRAIEHTPGVEALAEQEKQCALRCRAKVLRDELQKPVLQPGDCHAIRAMALGGCPDVTLRPQLWLILLGLRSNCDRETHRSKYRELRSNAIAALGADWRNSEIEGDACGRSQSLRAEVEADVRAVWRDAAFLQRTDTLHSIASITMTMAYTNKKSQPIRHSGVLATLLLFVMSSEGSDATLDDAEADAFWCLWHVVQMLPGGTSDDAMLASKARRLQLLLQIYDPAVAELLASHNLDKLLATRLGVALCTRMGFTLQQCAHIWDTFLADPQRFDHCDFFVIAFVLTKRRQVLRAHQDVGAVAEAVLANPAADTTFVESLLRTSNAICAFERRCGKDSDIPYPPRPGVLDAVASAASNLRNNVGTLFHRVRGSGVLQGFARQTKGGAGASNPNVLGNAPRGHAPTGYGAVSRDSFTLREQFAASSQSTTRRAVSLDRAAQAALETGLI